MQRKLKRRRRWRHPRSARTCGHSATRTARRATRCRAPPTAQQPPQSGARRPQPEARHVEHQVHKVEHVHAVEEGHTTELPEARHPCAAAAQWSRCTRACPPWHTAEARPWSSSASAHCHATSQYASKLLEGCLPARTGTKQGSPLQTPQTSFMAHRGEDARASGLEP